jgi:O-antigen ligase/tetratricopeptide (TPR) repeat protein
MTVILGGSPIARQRLAIDWPQLIDTAVKSCLVVIIVSAPLANGAVSHEAATAFQIVALGLVALCMVRALIGAQHGWFAIPIHMFSPALILMLLIAFQLVPLPSSLLRIVSPRTFQVYSRTLNGYPEYTPYRDLMTRTKEATSDSRNSIATRIGNWRTISLAPSVTRSALLKFIAYTGIFLVVLLYPFAGPEAATLERRFSRTMLIAILVSALVSAFLALVMWSTDARGDQIMRAAGTFVNPDHFACFIAMVLPVALACTLFGSNLIPARWCLSFRIFCAITFFVTMVGLLLSGSRSGWGGAAIGIAGLLIFARPSALTQPRNWVAELGRLTAAAAICVLLMVFIGARGQQAVGQRLQQAATDATLAGRLGVWKDSLPMAADFPLFGVGLGCWSEMFPQYQSPPWPVDSYWAQTHNDYLQLLSEIGLIGFCFVALLFVRLFRRVMSAARNFDLCSTPLAAGIVGSVAAVMVEECVDFGLQLRANALTLTVLLALGSRMADQSGVRPPKAHWAVASPFASGALGIIAGVLAIVAMVCTSGAARYNPKTPLQARSFVLAHPALLDAHMSLLEQFGRSMTYGSFRAEVETALWVEPTNPYARDLHALVLMNGNERKHALSEVSESLVRSPALSTHSFLFPDISRLASLPTDEKEAIRTGLSEAAARGYQDAVQNLGDFYNAIGQSARAADTYTAAAVSEADAVRRSTFLIEAGDSAIMARDLNQAQTDFERAISTTPQSAVAYGRLIGLMFRKSDETAAQKIAEKAIRNDLDPSYLYRQLAEGEREVGHFSSAQSFALKALDRDPRNPEAITVLGTIYLAQSKYPDAIILFQRLCELTPNSGQAFFYLATAEERDYQWFAAEKSFRRALLLEPGNRNYKAHYDQFEANLGRNKPLRQLGSST